MSNLETNIALRDLPAEKRTPAILSNLDHRSDLQKRLDQIDLDQIDIRESINGRDLRKTLAHKLSTIPREQLNLVIEAALDDIARLEREIEIRILAIRFVP